jgi:hypothetical protein
MKEINAWPIGSAKSVSNMNEIPTPNKLIGKFEGYCFYKTRHGEYAIKDRNSPD